MFTLRNVKWKRSIDKKSPFIVTHGFKSLITLLKGFYNLIIDFNLYFFTFFIKTDCSWMFTSGNMKQKPSIEKKRPFIVTHAFETFIAHFKWLYDLIINFKLNFFTFFVKTDYNWMFTLRNMKRKPSIGKKSPFIVTHAFKTLLLALNAFIISLLILCWIFLHF